MVNWNNNGSIYIVIIVFGYICLNIIYGKSADMNV